MSLEKKTTCRGRTEGRDSYSARKIILKGWMREPQFAIFRARVAAAGGAKMGNPIEQNQRKKKKQKNKPQKSQVATPAPSKHSGKNQANN